eukprot:TRINITY_DN29804_c0_g1_i1.p1 TRINITY_DN29804_c0_g1~~TRINITY_DN29804_c0_g1_i1.p1  ORF type:complete len:269 (+),score=17.73 TRINITY_DN29804_c0_g1_i1:175-981(+)
MPGPGVHILYPLAIGLGLKHLTLGRFTIYHCMVYTLNAVVGPDIGPVSEWLLKKAAPEVGSRIMAAVHHPVGYTVTMGAPLAFFYWWLSWWLMASGGRFEKTGMKFSQCLLLITAGSLSHFFLDTLFEENGSTPLFRWILSTGYWRGEAPLYPDSCLIIALLCLTLLGGVMYLNSRFHRKRIFNLSDTVQSIIFLAIIATLYCAWCAYNLYGLSFAARRPPVGEEADLGVIVFLATFVFLPHILCLLSMPPLVTSEHDKILPILSSKP